MHYIINITDQNYEAGVALCNKVVRELNKGAIMPESDLEYFEALLENVSTINRNIHKEVMDAENKRYGGSKSICEELKRLIAARREQIVEEEKTPDFEKMSKEELIAYIKSNETKKVEEPVNDKEFVLKNPDEVNSNL